MARLAVAIIGAGAVVEHRHAPAWQALDGAVHLVALAETHAVRRRNLGRLLDIPTRHRYRHVEDLLRMERPDAVVIATPPLTRGRYARLASQAGMNVIAESPLAAQTTEFDRVVAAAAATDAVLAPIHAPAQTPTWRAVGKLVGAHSIGPPITVRMHWAGSRAPAGAGDDPMWRLRAPRAGGGVLLDVGYHQIRRALGLGAASVTGLHATCRSAPLTPDAEVRASLTLEHSDGAVSVIQAAWGAAELGHRDEIIGRDGQIRRIDDRVQWRPPGSFAWHEVDVGPPGDDGYVAALRQGVDRVRTRRVAAAELHRSRLALDIVERARVVARGHA